MSRVSLETKTDRFAVCPKLVKSGMSIEREHMKRKETVKKQAEQADYG